MVNRKAVILSLKPKEHQNLCFCALSFCVNYTLIGQCVLTMCAFFFFFLWIFPPKSIFYLINNPPFSHSLQAVLYSTCAFSVPSYLPTSMGLHLYKTENGASSIWSVLHAYQMSVSLFDHIIYSAFGSLD